MDECIWAYEEYNNELTSVTYKEEDIVPFIDEYDYMIYFFADTVSHPNAR